MVTPTLPHSPAAAGPAGASPPPRPAEGARSKEQAREAPGRAVAVAALQRLLAPLEMSLAVLALAGASVFVATLLQGRTALIWPSAAWAGTAAAALAIGTGLWWLATRAAAGSGWRRWRAACWPTLALLPSAFAAAAVYADDVSNHFVSAFTPTRQTLLAYTGVLAGSANAIYWLRVALRRRHAPAWLRRAGATQPLALGLAAAAYVNNAIFLLWIPRQTDLTINLVGAREMLRGVSPYHVDVAQWADRVHLLPSTLLLLFGPLALLPDSVARLLFFLGNQALWLLGLGIVVRRLAPRSEQMLWLAGVLAFGATFWPWQESIRFGQQDGLIVLLYALSITAAASGRDLAAGVALGLALPVKPVSIWLPLVYLLHGRWRALLIGGAIAASLVLATLPFTWEMWWYYVRVQLPDMVSGTVRGTNIPLPALHARFFVGREALGGGDPAPFYAVIQALNLAATLLGLLMVIRLWMRPSADRQRAWLLDAALGLTLTILLAPYAWQHYASWLAIAFLILALPTSWRPLSPWARAGVATLAGASFLLLSLQDDRLIRLLSPLVDRWPAVMALYTLGLCCLAGAVVTARLGGTGAPPPE